MTTTPSWRGFRLTDHAALAQGRAVRGRHADNDCLDFWHGGIHRLHRDIGIHPMNIPLASFNGKRVFKQSADELCRMASNLRHKRRPYKHILARAQQARLLEIRREIRAEKRR